MGWYGDSIRLGSGQQHRFGHRYRRGFFDELNSDDHHDEDWLCWWLGTRHGDVTSCCVDSNILRHEIDG